MQVKPMSDIHEFVLDMLRVSANYNSPQIATNVNELCHKSFGQNCSTTSIQHVHDIHGKISVGSCNLYKFIRHLYELYGMCMRTT